MCVRTKTSYGCGHVYKQDQPCRQSSCVDLERYHLQSEGDCGRCKRDGDKAFRGREGYGRYAQELHKHRRHSPSRGCISHFNSAGKRSTWTPSVGNEAWTRSRIRKLADDAWEQEHAQREDYLQNHSRGSDSRHDLAEEPYAKRPACHDRYYEEAVMQERPRKHRENERLRARRQHERQVSYGSFESLQDSCCSCKSPAGGQSYNTSQSQGSYTPPGRSLDDLGHSRPATQASCYTPFAHPYRAVAANDRYSQMCSGFSSTGGYYYQPSSSHLGSYPRYIYV